MHQVGGDQNGAVARGEGEGAFALTDVEPDMVERDALPIAPDVALHDGLAQGFSGAGTARDDRVRPIRADHEAGPFDMSRAVPARDNDAGDPAAILDQIDDAHAVAKLRAGSHRRLGEHSIEQVPAGPVGFVAAVHRRRRAAQHGAVQVDPPVGKGRGARGDLGQNTPIAQMGDTERVDQVRRLPHVAGEAVAVEKQHTMALAGQQHGRGRTGAAGADDDRVVNRAPPRGVSSAGSE